MHELGIMTGVMDAVQEAATNAGADKVLKVSLSVGVMTEAIEDALEFAFEALSEGTMCEGAELQITMVQPRSVCLDCGTEFEHDRFHMLCPNCGGFATKLIAGREMQIDSVDVDIPDDDERAGDGPAAATDAPSAPSGDRASAEQAFVDMMAASLDDDAADETAESSE